MNRIDPDLFAACFSSSVAECWPNRPDPVAIDGKARGAAMIASAARRRCTWYQHSPPPPRLLGRKAVDEKSTPVSAPIIFFTFAT
jgi:hypothetical protein